jgi:hypothetical protein
MMMMMMIVEQSVECEFTGQNEIFGENLTQCHFAHHESYMTRAGLEPGPSRWKTCD